MQGAKVHHDTAADNDGDNHRRADRAMISKRGRLAKRDRLVNDRNAEKRRAESAMSAERRISRRALHLVVRDHLAQLIGAGLLSPGSLFPDEAVLAEQLGVSVIAVRKALESLAEECLITRGSSSEITPRNHGTKAQPDWGRQQPQNAARLLKTERREATLEEQQRLELEAAAMVLRVAVVGGQAFHLYEERTLSLSRFPGLGGLASTGPPSIGTLAQHCGVLLGRTIEKLDVVVADGSIANVLEVDEGIRILRLDRVVYSAREVPLEWRIAYYHSESIRQ